MAVTITKLPKEFSLQAGVSIEIYEEEMLYKNEDTRDYMMELKDNQAALILEVDGDGGVSVNVASGDVDGPAGAICQAIAVKLMQDKVFQADIMDMIEVDGGGSEG